MIPQNYISYNTSVLHLSVCVYSLCHWCLFYFLYELSMTLWASCFLYKQSHMMEEYKLTYRTLKRLLTNMTEYTDISYSG